jgi:hypothetical protein
MIKNKKMWAYVAIIFMAVIVSAVTFNKVTAIASQEYKTTIIDSHGLEIEVADVKSSDVTNIEDYIKENINESYAKNDKLEARDIMLIKNVIAEDSKLAEDKTIDSLWNNYQEAFIMMSDAYVLLYDTDETSDYYVAYVDTMHSNNESTVTDTSFAYTNVNGDVITDAIYDYNTGLAYVPKKYTEENKNGLGYVNVQVELLQIVDSANPSATFDVEIEKDDDIKGKFSTTGTATLKAIATEFGIKIALDDEAKNNIDENYLKVYLNNEEIDNYTYYQEAGAIVVEAIPSTIETLKISISSDNVNDNITKANENAKNGISTQSSFDEISSYGDAGEWIVTGVPTEGSLIKITKDEANMWYDAWDHEDSANGNVADVPIFAVGTGTSAWTNLVKLVQNGGSVDTSNLYTNATWIQWNIDLYGTVTTTDSNGVTYEIPQASWLLKCVHNSVSLGDGVWRQTDPDGYPRWHATEMWVRILKVTDDYLLVGMLTPSANTQAGTGL